MGEGYLEAGASYTHLRGPEAWAEAGWHPAAPVGLFARGFANSLDSGVMAGVRWTF